MMALRLFNPKSWTSNSVRACGRSSCAPRSANQASQEIDRVIASGVRFCCVLADADYGLSAPFRKGLMTRGLAWVSVSLVPRRFIRWRLN